jgi:predicted oxidoreductase
MKNLKSRNKLHPEGPEFSSISAGFWRLHEWEFSTDDLLQFIESCFQAGITTFDHADIYGDYGNEARFGAALEEKPSLRSQMELVSKCGICLTTGNRPRHRVQHYNTTGEYIRNCAEQSLRNLNSDYLDLLLIHRPDPLMDASEIADTFSALIEEGKIRHAGVSNFTPSQFDLLQSRMDHPLVTNQVEASLLHTEFLFDGTLDQAQRNQTAPMIWSPFAGGRLFTGTNQQAIRVRSVLTELAEKYGASMDQIALAWLLRLPSRPLPVTGTGKIERIQSAAKSLDVQLDRQDWFLLLKASRGHDVA